MGQQIVPDRLGFGTPAVLIGGHAHIEAGHHILAIEGERALERGLGVDGYDAVGCGHQRLAVIGLA